MFIEIGMRDGLRAIPMVSLVLEDLKLENSLRNFLEAAEISRLEIERAGDDNVRVIIHSARPGTVIGKKGQEIETFCVSNCSCFWKEKC